MVLDDRRVDEEPPRRTGSACGGGLRDQREDDVALERCQFVFARVYVGEGGRVTMIWLFHASVREWS
jgi:hypothetical protein